MPDKPLSRKEKLHDDILELITENPVEFFRSEILRVFTQAIVEVATGGKLFYDSPYRDETYKLYDDILDLVRSEKLLSKDERLQVLGRHLCDAQLFYEDP